MEKSGGVARTSHFKKVLKGGAGSMTLPGAANASAATCCNECGRRSVLLHRSEPMQKTPRKPEAKSRSFQGPFLSISPCDKHLFTA